MLRLIWAWSDVYLKEMQKYINWARFYFSFTASRAHPPPPFASDPAGLPRHGPHILCAWWCKRAQVSASAVEGVLQWQQPHRCRLGSHANDERIIAYWLWLVACLLVSEGVSRVSGSVVFLVYVWFWLSHCLLSVSWLWLCDCVYVCVYLPACYAWAGTCTDHPFSSGILPLRSVLCLFIGHVATPAGQSMARSISSSKWLVC